MSFSHTEVSQTKVYGSCISIGWKSNSIPKTLYDQTNFEPAVKKNLPVVCALSMISSPELAWGWGGDGNCPYSKNK